MLDEQSTATTAVPATDFAHRSQRAADPAAAATPAPAPHGVAPEPAPGPDLETAARETAALDSPARNATFRRRSTSEHSAQAELHALARRVATARGKLPLQADPALFAELSEREIAAERRLAEWIRAQRRRQRKRAVIAQLAAEKRDRRVALALRRADDADARWHRRARAGRLRASNPDARLAQLFRRAEWSSRALIGVVVLGMVWAGVNVQHNLVPSGDMSDPLYWLSYGFEAMISIPIITIMVVATTAARWGRDIDRGKVVFLEVALLGVTVALNAGPHLVAGAPARAAEAAVAPVMVGVVIWLHAWVSARYAQLIDDIPVEDSESGDLPPSGYRPSYRTDTVAEWPESRSVPEQGGWSPDLPGYPQLTPTAVAQRISDPYLSGGWESSDSACTATSFSADAATAAVSEAPASSTAVVTAEFPSTATRSAPRTADRPASPTTTAPAPTHAAPADPATTAALDTAVAGSSASAAGEAAGIPPATVSSQSHPTAATESRSGATESRSGTNEPEASAAEPTDPGAAPEAKPIGLRIVPDEPARTRTRRAVDDAVQLVLGEPADQLDSPRTRDHDLAELAADTGEPDPEVADLSEDGDLERELADVDPVADESGDAAIWSVAREIRRRGLSKLSVDQLAEILTLTDESWTPAAIGAAVGLPGSRVLGILETARRISLPVAVGG